jgi:lysozyme
MVVSGTSLALPVMANKFNAAGLALVEQWEGLFLTAYQDIAGVWTIGYGHTPAYDGEVITSSYAQVLLKNDLTSFESIVAAVTHDVQTTDNQFSAMVSLAFNIGSTGFRGSTVLRRHRQGSYQAAAAAFLLWDKAHVDGELVTVQGLLNRRMAEMALYRT